MATRPRLDHTIAAAPYLQLEERCLLAGNVTVFESSNLYVRGDLAANRIEVVADGNELRINGLDGTTINGSSSYTVQSTSQTSSGVVFDGGLRVHLGPGNDDLSVRDVQFESLSVIYGGTGNDRIDLVESRFSDRVTVQTFDGNDTVLIDQSVFDDAFAAMTLDGRDTVRLVDSTFRGNSTVITGAHLDTVHSDSVRFDRS